MKQSFEDNLLHLKASVGAENVSYAPLFKEMIYSETFTVEINLLNANFDCFQRISRVTCVRVSVIL